MAKIPITSQDLSRHLEMQKALLRRSAEAFDKGFEDEAVRLALTIRILAHDTANSVSLLQQLGIKDTLQFRDTSKPDLSDNLASSGSLVNMAQLRDVAPTTFIPMLDDYAHVHRDLSFSQWWTMPVLRDRMVPW